MKHTELGFFLLIGVAALLYRMLPPQRLRNLVLALAGILFHSFASGWIPFLVYLGVVVATYAVAQRLSSATAPEARGHYLATGCWLVAALLVASKYQPLFKRVDVDAGSATITGLALLITLGGLMLVGRLQPSPVVLALGAAAVLFPWALRPTPGETLLEGLDRDVTRELAGASYLAFRHISYLVDVSRRRSPPGELSSVMAWALFPPIVAAGPIERFEHLSRQLNERTRADLSDVRVATQRLLTGFFYTTVVNGFFLTGVVAPWLESWKDRSAVYLWGQGYLLAARLFTDFAGYTHLAVGYARLFGLQVVENFDRPYRRLNLAEFWRGWHISLSLWIRDYAFYPLCGTRASRGRLLGATFLSMVACGLWHGATSNFLVWGAWHGLGLVTYLEFRRRCSDNERLARFCDHPAARPFWWFLNFHFVCLGWLLFDGRTFWILRSALFRR